MLELIILLGLAMVAAYIILHFVAFFFVFACAGIWGLVNFIGDCVRSYHNNDS